MSAFLETSGQLALFGMDELDLEAQPVKPQRKKVPAKPVSQLVSIPYLYLDLSPGHVDLFGNPYWELRSPYREGKPPLNTGPAPREPVHSSLSEILEPDPDTGYYLSVRACRGILRRAEERGKELPPQLETALRIQAGLTLKAHHINQQDAGINLGDVQMQTFITETHVEGCLTPWDTQQARIFTLENEVSALAGADGGNSRNPAGLLFAAGFCAGAAPSAGGVGYHEEISPTLKASESGTNQVPSVLCLNDQGGSVMDCSEGVTGTLRAQEHGHQPLVFENHGIDARYTGPHPVAPTLSARTGTGGNNLPLVEQQNTVFSRRRVDKFSPSDVASTESARQHKDATDLVYQKTVGALTSSDRKGPNNQYVGQDKLVVECPQLIRRLTPLECERLQGFPDGWTALPGTSDSARYRALGNSVAIPCVEFIMWGIATVLRYDR